MRLLGRLLHEPAAPEPEPPAVEAGELLDLATGILVRHFLELGVSARRAGRRVEFRQCGVVCELRLQDLTRSTVVLGSRIWLDFREEPIEAALSWSAPDHREAIGHLVVQLAHGVLAPILRLEGAEAGDLPVVTHRLVCAAEGTEPEAWRLFAGEPAIAGGSHVEVHALEERGRQHADLVFALGPALAALATTDRDTHGFHWWTAHLARAADGSVGGLVTLDGVESADASSALAASILLPGTGLLAWHQFGVMRAMGPAPGELVADLDARGTAGPGPIRWLIR